MQKLGLDLDGVVFDFNNTFIPWHNEKYNSRWNIADLTAYDYEKSFPVSKRDFYDHLEVFGDEGGYLRIPFYPGVVQALKKRLKRGDQLFINTARCELGFQAAVDLFHREKLDLAGGARADAKNGGKAALAQQMDLDFHYEDNQGIAEQVAEAGVPTFLISQRYNRDWRPPCHLPIVRARDLRSALSNTRFPAQDAGRR